MEVLNDSAEDPDDSLVMQALQNSGGNEHENANKCIEMYKEDPNFLVASWMNDLGIQQNEFDDKILFFNSESILNNNNLLSHFSKSNKKELDDKNIEIFCKKGQ